MPRAVGPSPASPAPSLRAAPVAASRAARDRHLVEAYRAGRREAFDDLVRAYQRPVQRLLCRLRVMPSELEDLEQEVFLRAFRKLPAFRSQASFYTWLYRLR